MYSRIARAVGLVVILAAVNGLPHTNVSAFGINCEGSLKCHGQPGETASRLVGYINGIDGGRFYNNGQHIACRTIGERPDEG
ncbi:hypothetical protein B0H17DRAFT_1091150 [Mycena rosella]|uniref:Killer toxin Kp4 domain-containing protein n=1 Tax=Mycena rosella TaxID=1033263 RepID=A0AAD7CV18_MYCRO|nr:hypothetical protein B0H17DRAFT_1091150 [Mycena rosella]